MLSVATRLLATLHGALSGADAAALSMQDRLEEIRQRMLDSLAETGGWQMSELERHLLLAPDAESLWYLRPELLMAVAARHGERVARQLIEEISAQFEGLLPRGLAPPRLARLRRGEARAFIRP